MILDLVGSVVTILVLLVGFVVSPARAECPLPEAASPPGGRGGVYCTGGTVPVTRDGRAIGCMRVNV